MTAKSQPQPEPGGFTLVEITVSMGIVAFLVLLLSLAVSGVGRVWVAGGQRVENFQNGRAILEMIARDLSPALISGHLQFVQNPDLAGSHPLLSGTVAQAAHSDSLFWQAPLSPNSCGDVSEVGYLLTQDLSAPASPKYRLQRFFAPPDNAAPATSAAHYCRIADAATDFTGYTAGSRWLPADGAPWLTQLTAASFQKCLSPLSDGVIAFWVRCLDRNGDPIPWLKDAPSYSSASPMKFNSAAGFNPAIQGVANSFQYTGMETTIAANRLPSAVELTIVTIDTRALKRPGVPEKINGIIATGAAPENPGDVPAVARQFMDNLASNQITTARLFSTTVRLINGTD